MLGETNPPATPATNNGNTNTHTTRSSYSATNIAVNYNRNLIINAVDANGNVVSSASYTVGVTGSDPARAGPANAALVGGTKTFSVTLKTAGSQTVTATDLDDGAKAANTSPAITVNAGALAQ